MIYKLILISIILGLLLLFISEKFINVKFMDKLEKLSIFLIIGLPIILYLFGDIFIVLIQDAIKNGIASSLMKLSIILGWLMIILLFFAIAIRDNDGISEAVCLLLKISFYGFLIIGCLSCVAYKIF